MITGNYELTLSEENLKISRKAKLSKGKKKTHLSLDSTTV